MTPRLETPRLILREWREDDLDGFARFWANEATARYVGGVKSREDAWRVMAMHVGHWNLQARRIEPEGTFAEFQSAMQGSPARVVPIKEGETVQF